MLIFAYIFRFPGYYFFFKIELMYILYSKVQYLEKFFIFTYLTLKNK